MNPLRICLLVCAFGLLAACGPEPEPEAAAPKPAPQPAHAAAPDKEDPTSKMARAVGTGKPGAAVDIRYEIASKPEVGKATGIQIALIPSVGVDSMEATIGGMEGVTLAGELTASFVGVEAGKPYSHTFSMLPDRTGVFYVTVSVNTRIGGSTLGRTFSIPFVVGDVQEQQKPAAAPQKDASGQAIEPMQAEETRR